MCPSSYLYSCMISLKQCFEANKDILVLFRLVNNRFFVERQMKSIANLLPVPLSKAASPLRLDNGTAGPTAFALAFAAVVQN